MNGMRGKTALGLILLSGVLLVATAGAPKEPARVKAVTVLIRNRVFHEFFDKQIVALNEEFQVGDTDYTAELVEYVPDFAIDIKAHKVTTRSTEPNNPAFHIIVKEKGAPTDTVWAFLNTPPHFARKSMLAFKIHEIEFIGHKKIVAPPEPKSPAPAGGAQSTGTPPMLGMPGGMPSGHPMPGGMPPGHPTTGAPTSQPTSKPAAKGGSR